MRVTKELIIVIAIIIALMVCVFVGIRACENYKDELARIPPLPPKDLIVKKVSSTQIDLEWEDASNNELGFRIIRDDEPIRELPEDSTSFSDYELKPSTVYEYEIIAYNNAGESPKASVVIKTKNPRLVVRLDRIGVIDNGEDFFRELIDKHGEIFIGVVVKDGINTWKRRLPAEGYYKLADNTAIEVRELIFTSDAIGDYLSINIIGFENDGGTAEELLVQALNIAATSSFGPLGSIMLSLAGVGFTDTFKDIANLKDDYLGEYNEEWPQSDNWGIGSYEDIRCNKGDGIGLRLWFTVSTP